LREKQQLENIALYINAYCLYIIWC